MAAGPRGSVSLPAGETLDASGLTLLPGLIDAHFHRGSIKLPNIFLNNGVTSVREEGQHFVVPPGAKLSLRVQPERGRGDNMVSLHGIVVIRK